MPNRQPNLPLNLKKQNHVKPQRKEWNEQRLAEMLAPVITDNGFELICAWQKRRPRYRFTSFFWDWDCRRDWYQFAGCFTGLPMQWGIGAGWRFYAYVRLWDIICWFAVMKWQRRVFYSPSPISNWYSAPVWGYFCLAKSCKPQPWLAW